MLAGAREHDRRQPSSLTVYGAVGLLALFSVQFVVSITAPPSVNQVVIVALSVVYVVLAIGQFVRRRRQTVQVIRDGIVTPFSRLERAAS